MCGNLLSVTSAISFGMYHENNITSQEGRDGLDGTEF